MGVRKMSIQDIQEIYRRCGAAFGNEQIPIRTTINTGSLDNTLNTNRAGIDKRRDQTTFVNSTIKK